MNTTKRIAQCLLLLLPTVVDASEAIAPPQHGAISVAITNSPTSQVSNIRLDVRHGRLSEIIDTLAAKSGTRVYQRHLPEEFVSATCAGTSVKQVLECLLGPSANLVVRYPSNDRASATNHDTAELWVLGKASNSPNATPASPASGRCDPSTTTEPDAPAPINVHIANEAHAIARNDTAARSEHIDDTVDKRLLIARAAADDAATRADALAQLSAQSNSRDADVRTTLEVALQDDDPDVRAQALFALSGNRQGWAVGAIQTALHDDDVSVRLMAVDSAGDNVALLHEALTDADETVRTFAAMRMGLQQ